MESGNDTDQQKPSQAGGAGPTIEQKWMIVNKRAVTGFCLQSNNQYISTYMHYSDVSTWKERLRRLAKSCLLRVLRVSVKPFTVCTSRGITLRVMMFIGRVKT